MITDRNAFDSTRFGLEIGYALQKLYPGKIDWDTNRFLIGNHAVIQAGKVEWIRARLSRRWRRPLEDFVERREKYLLYK